MKVALIADVHANLPALEAVLSHASQQGVDAVWNLGDLVCFGPYPDEVVQLLRTECVLATSGEYDRRVVSFDDKQDKWRRKKTRAEYVALRWAHERLSKKSRKYLRFLSKEERVTVKGRRFLLTHACLDSGGDSIGPDTAVKELRKLAKEAKADAILCGHSHQPFARQVDGTWFINPGSTGMGFGGDSQVSYTVLRISPEGLEVHPFQLEYDVDDLVATLRKENLPEAFAQMFLQGQDLDAMLDSED